MLTIWLQVVLAVFENVFAGDFVSFGGTNYSIMRTTDTVTNRLVVNTFQKKVVSQTIYVIISSMDDGCRRLSFGPNLRVSHGRMPVDNTWQYRVYLYDVRTIRLNVRRRR